MSNATPPGDGGEIDGDPPPFEKFFEVAAGESAATADSTAMDARSGANEAADSTAGEDT